uniref:Diablo, IAP-binding mitochondrial protein a n=1 Tax=Neogobius melanostomus TaxID=47308 RepID=A0A8C6WNT7_9GOBI
MHLVRRVFLFRSSDNGVLGTLNSSAQKLQDSTNTTHMSKASLSVGLGLYAVPFTQQVENLSHDSLIRRAASVVTDSSSTFLSQTTLALIDSLADYAKAVHTRIALQRQYLATLGKLSPAEDDSLWKLINNQRAEVTDRLSQCKHYETTWTFAMDISKMAVEAAYVSGAEQASITIRTNIQLAQSQIDEAKKGSAEADRKLAETKADEIQRMAEYHAFLQNNDHEMHEAYLRED